MKEISILIPVYNEEKIIVSNATRLISFLKHHFGEKFEIIICSNGSTDSTEKLGKMLEKMYPSIKFISLKRRGVGAAFRYGLAISSSPFIISLDMDLSIDLNFILKCKSLLRYYDIVIGSKERGFQKRSRIRIFLSKIFNRLVRLLLDLNYSDFSIGGKGFRRDFLLEIINSLDFGSFYIIQIIYFGKFLGKKIKEIPVGCIDIRLSKFSLLGETLYRFFKLLNFWLKIEWRNITKTPR